MSELAVRVLVATLREGRAVRWVVRGGSMWPTVPDGSEIEASPCAAGDLRAGELGVFARAGALTVHRLVGWRGTALVFRGDSLARDDLPVEAAAVLGRARVTRRGPLRWNLPRAMMARGLLRFALEWAREKGQR